MDLVPRPDKDQIKSLKNSMLEDGQQVRIIVNPQGVILDGHTRFNICESLNLKPKYLIKKFNSLQKEKEFVISANLNRRQLTLFERGEILFSWWKEERKRTRVIGIHAANEARRKGTTYEGTSTGKKERLLNKFAKIIGSSASVCHQLTWLLLHAPEDVKIKLRKEEMTIRAAYTEIAKPIRKSKQDYIKEGRIYLRHTRCLNCGKQTVSNTKTNCHVHNEHCCTKCGWGN